MIAFVGTDRLDREDPYDVSGFDLESLLDYYASLAVERARTADALQSDAGAARESGSVVDPTPALQAMRSQRQQVAKEIQNHARTCEQETAGIVSFLRLITVRARLHASEGLVDRAQLEHRLLAVACEDELMHAALEASASAAPI